MFQTIRKLFGLPKEYSQTRCNVTIHRLLIADYYLQAIHRLHTKVTLEPPQGLKAGLSRTYQTLVSQEVLDKIDNEKWRLLLFVLAFEHSIVQERRKFGPIGWCVPYEYNSADFDACANFLERYLSSTVTVGLPISWSTVQYMISEVQYGGRITDDLDRELFNTYVAKWFNDDIFKPAFAFNNYAADFNYKLLEVLFRNDGVCLWCRLVSRSYFVFCKTGRSFV